MNETQPNKLRKALIFGVTGQDGHLLAHLLLGNNFRVLGVSRYAISENKFLIEELNKSEQLETASLNLLVKDNVRSILDDFKPEIVFNLSGITSVAKSIRNPAETFESIAVATQNILEAIRTSGREIRFLNAGSSECFGDSFQNKPHTEESRYCPESPYASAKVAALYLTDTYRKFYNVLGYSAILSNHESILRKDYFVTKKVVSTLKKIADGKESLLTLGNLGVSRDFGWAPNYVEAMYAIVESQFPDNYIVCTGQTNTLENFVEKCCDYYGLRMKECVKIDPSLCRPNEPKEISLSPQKIYDVLGWKATTSFDEVVRKLCSNQLF